MGVGKTEWRGRDMRVALRGPRGERRVKFSPMPVLHSVSSGIP